MKVLFDTSALVAAMVASHPKHASCLLWLQRVQLEEIKGFIATHSLAELYAVLTRLPLKPQIEPRLAQQLLINNLKKFHVVPLEAKDYDAVIAKVVSLGIPGAAIYDGLIAQTALNVKVDAILTLNPKHFTRLGKDVAQLVQVPAK